MVIPQGWYRAINDHGHAIPLLDGQNTLSAQTTLAGISNAAVTITGDYQVTSTDYLILADTTGGNITVMLPSTPTNDPIYIIKKTAAANTVTINGNSNNIDGSGTATLTTLNTVLQVQFAGSQWRVLSSNPGGGGARVKSTALLNIYVNPVTGNDASDGFTPATAKRTIGAAYYYIETGIDMSGYGANIRCAAGTYNESLGIFGDIVGGHVIGIIGDIATPSNCIINSPNINDSCFYVKDYGCIQVSGFRLQGANGTFAIRVGQFGICDFGNIEFGDCIGGRHLTAEDFGKINAIGDYAIVGDATVHVDADHFSSVLLNQYNVTINTARAFTYYAVSANKGLIDRSTGVFLGAGVAGTTGQRYLAVVQSLINTNGAGINFFPGNVPGTADASSLYI